MRHEDPDPAADPAALRFNGLWEAYAGRVLAYAKRQVDPELAQEILADTFLVAWRRLDEVPEEPLPWLLVVARNTIANHHRSHRRRTALHNQLALLERVAETAPGADVSVAERAEVLAQLASLTDAQREALLLVAWDGLTPAEAARVSGCSTSTFQVRLFRARRRLQSHQTSLPTHHGVLAQPARSS